MEHTLDPLNTTHPKASTARVVVDVAESTGTEPPPKSRERPLVQWARLGLVLLFLFSFLQHACVTSYIVSGNSMMPSYSDGDRVVVAKMLPGFTRPHRGDTVIARVNGEIIIKRVIGLPGETICIGNGSITSGGRPILDPVPIAFRRMSDMDPVVLDSDEFFLMGDHRLVSIDSRDFGPVELDEIVGRVIMHFHEAAKTQ